MSNPLIKKQFTEIFRNYFVNQKTGEKRSKGKTVLFFLLFALLIVLLSGSFFGMGLMLIDFVTGPDTLRWLYYAVMGILAVVFGLFGSVFNTFHSLYLAKDNDLLLSLPIPPSKILSSRIIAVYGLSLLYSGMVWIPICILDYIFGKPSVFAVIFGILLLFVIPLFITVLSCALGFVVALISIRLKNKSFITVIITIAALSGYYFVYFRMTSTLKNIVANSEAVGNGIKKWGNLFYLVGMSANGDIKSFIIFTLLSAVLFAICLFVLSKTFIRITTMNVGQKKGNLTAQAAKQQKSVNTALLNREMKHFMSSAVYILNCALGTLVAPVSTVAVIIKRKEILAFIPALNEFFDVNAYLPIALAVVYMLILSMNTISTPSISLEGKTLWILKSLPIKPAEIIKAKRDIHFLITAPIVILSALIAGVVLKIGITELIMISCILLVTSILEADIGLFLGLKRANFNWTIETTPIKQTLNALLILLIGWLIPVIVGGGYFLIDRYTPIDIKPISYFVVLVVVISLITRLINDWNYNKGVKLFDEF